MTKLFILLQHIDETCGYREVHTSTTDLPLCSLDDLVECGRDFAKCSLEHDLVRQAVLLKAVEKGSRDVGHFRLLDDHHALKVVVHPTRFDVSANRNVGVVARPRASIDAVKAPVEELVETLVDGVGLAQDHRVSLGGRVTHSGNRVDLEGGEERGRSTA